MNKLRSNRILKTVVFTGVCALHLMVPLNVTTSMAAGFKLTGSVAEITACLVPADSQSSDKQFIAAKPPRTQKAVADPVYSIADSLYSALGLARKGLSRPAFRYAWKGYNKLLDKGRVRRSDILSICDFSQSSKRKRLYVIDLEEKKLLLQTFVAHGRNSGAEYARNFSNLPESHQSSLGFYVTRSTYFGEHGLALKIDGLERGINDKAFARNIVVHGSDYVGSDFLRSNKMNGRSYGCPAVPREQATRIINTIKQGSCLFIYHPSKKYLANSKILNV